MPCIDAQELRPEDTLIALTKKYPDIQAQDFGDFIRLSPADSDSSIEIWCDYRELDAALVQRDTDRFRYTFSHTTRAQEWVGPFSHPSEEGC